MRGDGGGAGKRKRAGEIIQSHSAFEPPTSTEEAVEVATTGKNDTDVIPPRLLYHTYEAGEVEEEFREAVAMVAATVWGKRRRGRAEGGQMPSWGGEEKEAGREEGHEGKDNNGGASGLVGVAHLHCRWENGNWILVAEMAM